MAAPSPNRDGAPLSARGWGVSSVPRSGTWNALSPPAESSASFLKQSHVFSMDGQIDTRTLDAPPDADLITELRDRAHDRGEAVGVIFPADGERKRLVASPRGTCVLLNETREDSFNPSVGVEEIAAVLRD